MIGTFYALYKLLAESKQQSTALPTELLPNIVIDFVGEVGLGPTTRGFSKMLNRNFLCKYEIQARSKTTPNFLAGIEGFEPSLTNS